MPEQVNPDPETHVDHATLASREMGKAAQNLLGGDASHYHLMRALVHAVLSVAEQVNGIRRPVHWVGGPRP